MKWLIGNITNSVWLSIDESYQLPKLRSFRGMAT